MSALRCAEFVELVTALLDRALDEESERLLFEHLASCDGCERYLDQMRWVIGALRDT